MALLDSKQLNPKLSGSFILSGSTQTFIGSSDFQGSVTASGDISGSGNITADNFTGTFNGAISSSAQIADNISGSTTVSSASFSTRVTTAEASGALFDGTGAVTFATVDTGQGANELYDMDQNVKTDSNVTFGNITATGTVTAEEFHTEFVSASIVFSSGSTKFGDTFDDIHQFTGSILIGSAGENTLVDSGSISGSATSTGSFGRVEAGGTVSADAFVSTTGGATIDFNDDVSLAGSLTTTGKIELGREPVQGINYLARLAEGKLSSAASAHTFTATAATKTSNHPYKDSGSSLGYIIDGVETPFLYLTEGYYKFDYSGASSHPIRFYFDAAKTTEYNPSTHVSVDGNVITLLIDKDSPQIIYYQCSSHGFMGWAIHTGQNALVQDINGFKTLVSGSAQLAADISGSFSKAQLDAKVANVVTSSAQIATDISGSSTALSSSLSTRLTTFDISQIDLDGGTDIGAAIVDADLMILDDGANGTNRKATMSRLKSYMSGVSGGSTLGNVQVGVTAATEIDTTSGNLIIDSDGGTVEITDDVNITGHVTASGNISSSASIIANDFSGSSVSTGSFGSLRIDSPQTLTIDNIGTVSGSSISTGSFGSLRVDSPQALTIDNIGTVSGSSISTGSFGFVNVAGMSIPSVSEFSSSVETRLESLSADIIALSIALG